MKHLTTDISERARRRWATALMHTGWWGGFACATLRTLKVLPDQVVVVTLFLVGVAVAASTARSRMRLSDTITQVFQTGLTTAVALQANAVTNACVVETDLEGRIIAVEHPEIIGWHNGDLPERALDDLIPDRFLRLHLATFKQFREDSEDGIRATGVTLHIPVLARDGYETPTRMTIARMGNILISTLVPPGKKEIEV